MMKEIKEKSAENEAKMSHEELVGFHKGSINTLMAERNELIRLVNVTESLLNGHVQELEKLGVKLVKGKE